MIDDIVNLLENDISLYISSALNNLELDDCDLKYFGDDEESHKKFINEIIRLKDEA